LNINLSYYVYFSRIELIRNENNNNFYLKYYNYIIIGSAPIKAKTKKYRVQFDIDSIPERDQVKAAEVRFTMKYDKVLRNGEIIHVILHDIIQPGSKGLSKPILRLGRRTIIMYRSEVFNIFLFYGFFVSLQHFIIFTTLKIKLFI